MDKGNKVIWLFGFSGAGKTTLAKEIATKYDHDGMNTILLDGDVIRNGINKDLSFSKEDRSENV